VVAAKDDGKRFMATFRAGVILRGLYKPRTGRTGHTGRCMNHAPAILAAPALIYIMHQLVVWIIVVHFHLCSLLDRYTVLEV